MNKFLDNGGIILYPTDTLYGLGVDALSTEALKKLIGGNDIPTLAVGDQYVRGFADVLWHAALDAGGYPRAVANRGAAVPAPVPTTPSAAPPAR